mmetsp:Transcript_24591/g.54370  ORF Transcript_24591/g.54370 Transcript_24591/m.54370 type:complete len:161 (+) Transcript_24591:138-620(+)
MDRVQVEDTPAEKWKASLNATCNRLSTQYGNLLRSASSAAALQEQGTGGGDGGSISHDPRSGGGMMRDSNEPPPPLAADASLSALQAKLAAHNLCVASANLLDLIRTLRLSALLMDEETIAAEEEEGCEECHDLAEEAVRESVQLEAELFSLRNYADAGR